MWLPRALSQVPEQSRPGGAPCRCEPQMYLRSVGRRRPDVVAMIHRGKALHKRERPAEPFRLACDSACDCRYVDWCWSHRSGCWIQCRARCSATTVTLTITRVIQLDREARNPAHRSSGRLPGSLFRATALDLNSLTQHQLIGRAGTYRGGAREHAHRVASALARRQRSARTVVT